MSRGSRRPRRRARASHPARARRRSFGRAHDEDPRLRQRCGAARRPSATVATQSADAPAPSAARATSVAPCPYPFALTTAQSSAPSSASSSRRALWRIAPRSIVISLRCTGLVSRERPRQRLDHVARDEAGALLRLARRELLRRARRRRGALRLHPLREERGRDAGQDVARARGCERRQAERADEDAAARRGDERVLALEDDDASNRSAASCTDASRCAATSFDSRPSRRPSSPSCGVRTRGAGHSPGSSSKSASASTTAGSVDLREQTADERLRLLLAPEPGPDARAPSPSRAASKTLLERPLHRLQHERLEHRKRLGRRGDRDVAGVGAERGARRERRRLRSCPREPPTTRTWPDVYLLSRGERRGTSARIAGVTSRCSVSAGSSPMSATTTSPARKRPGATARPTFGPCIVTVTSASHRRARDLAGRRVHARRDVDRDDRDAGCVDLLDQRAPSRRAARPSSRCRAARRS